MAKMLGALPADRWERNVYRELKDQLPADWVVIANVGWTLASGGGPVRDGQADFVILVPESGMVVLEVKGTREFEIRDDGRWYRLDHLEGYIPLTETPPDQAIRNMHCLAKIVVQSGGWNEFPGRYSYIVVYPNGEANRVPTMFDESTLITSRHRHLYASRIRHSLERRGFGTYAARMTAPIVEQIGMLLTSRPFKVTKVDAPDERHADIEKINDLTRHQFAALRGIFELPKVAVLGPAGTGKTLLAIWRLRALIEEGRRALYVCFNKNLAATLRRSNPECAGYIVNVDKFFSDITVAEPIAARNHRVPFGGGQTDYFRKLLPWAAHDVFTNKGAEAQFDAIIIDEGQDFSEDQLLVLDTMLRPDSGQWLFFADWRQNLFKAGNDTVAGAEVVFNLYFNCRNTSRVNGATNNYLNQQIQSMPGIPEGVLPEIIHCASEQALVERAYKTASAWEAGRGVVILSPRKLENSVMAGHDYAHGLKLVESIDAFGQPSTVYFSTVRSFKGLEADNVILVDPEIPQPNSVFGNEDLYVACTRPIGRLAILTTNAEVAKWYRDRI